MKPDLTHHNNMSGGAYHKPFDFGRHVNVPKALRPMEMKERRGWEKGFFHVFGK
jgi:hypothetical protein